MEIVFLCQLNIIFRRLFFFLLLDIQGTVWPDTKLGPLSPKDKRFVMPGLVGPESCNYSQSFKSPNPSISAEDVLQKLGQKEENIFQYMAVSKTFLSFLFSYLTA